MTKLDELKALLTECCDNCSEIAIPAIKTVDALAAEFEALNICIKELELHKAKTKTSSDSMRVSLRNLQKQLAERDATIEQLKQGHLKALDELFAKSVPVLQEVNRLQSEVERLTAERDELTAAAREVLTHVKANCSCRYASDAMADLLKPKRKEE